MQFTLHIKLYRVLAVLTGKFITNINIPYHFYSKV
jgi:hypothetical protein